MISIKRLLQIGLILASGISMPSWAIMMGSTDVGDVDTFIEEAAKVNGEVAETNWVNSVLVPDWETSAVTFTIKTPDPLDVNYFMTDTTNVFAFELLSEPEYFLIKNATRMALFKNLEDVDWGVFDASLLSSEMNIPTSGYTISHVTELNGSVPEPGVLGLLGIGMIGIVLGRRRMAA